MRLQLTATGIVGVTATCALQLKATPSLPTPAADIEPRPGEELDRKVAPLEVPLTLPTVALQPIPGHAVIPSAVKHDIDIALLVPGWTLSWFGRSTQLVLLVGRFCCVAASIAGVPSVPLCCVDFMQADTAASEATLEHEIIGGTIAGEGGDLPHEAEPEAGHGEGAGPVGSEVPDIAGAVSEDVAVIAGPAGSEPPDFAGAVSDDAAFMAGLPR